MRTHFSGGQLLNVQYKKKTVAFYAEVIQSGHVATWQLTWVFNDPSIWRPGFDPSTIHVEFACDKMAPRQIFLQARRFPISISSVVVKALRY